MEKDKYLLTFPVKELKKKVKIKCINDNISMNSFILKCIYKTHPEIFQGVVPSMSGNSMSIIVHDNGLLEFV